MAFEKKASNQELRATIAANLLAHMLTTEEARHAEVKNIIKIAVDYADMLLEELEKK